MGEIIFNSVEDFFKANGINKIDTFDNTNNIRRNTSEISIEEHLKLISEFHNKTMSFNGYISKRLNNYTGKRVEEFKVYIKRLRRDIKRLESTTGRNEFEEFVVQYGDKYLDRAEKCISQIYEWGYYNLIDRSMKRMEVCIGNSYHDNIRKNDSIIEILDTKHTGYNMVECDCAYYLTKLKNKGLKYNWNELTCKFCEYEGLGHSSEAFIISMVSYPHEFMRSLNKYRYRKKEWNDNEYSKDLTSAIERDGDSLLD